MRFTRSPGSGLPLRTSRHRRHQRPHARRDGHARSSRAVARLWLLAVFATLGTLAVVAVSPVQLALADLAGSRPEVATVERERVMVPAIRREAFTGAPGGVYAHVRAFAFETERPAVVQETPEPEVPVAVMASADAVIAIEAGDRRIYEADLLLLLEQHAPAYVTELATIGICESGRWDASRGSWYVRPDAVGDSGNSLGWLQLWRGWPNRFGTDLDPFDPVDAIQLALSIREARGRFGGPGGWTCADLRGVW